LCKRMAFNIFEYLHQLIIEYTASAQGDTHAD
jgi:hypothetical protein